MVIAVIGAGSIGRRHAENLAQLDVPHVWVPYRTFDANDLKTRDITGMVIATATPIRAELIALCANQNWPFYVEKPLGWTTAQVEMLYDLAAPVAARSMVGFMMRYHPAIQALQRRDLSDVYGFSCEIGHDVRQWRENWSFADSYASAAEGGGVLLDLCHEIDIAACLFPGLRIDHVASLDHPDFPRVDFATRIALSNGQQAGTVSMDYLNPISTRHTSLRSLSNKIEVDFLGPTITVGADVQDYSFDRNDMFLAAMRDFVALTKNEPPSEMPLLPRFDLCRESCDLIAQAWEARIFSGSVAPDMA